MSGVGINGTVALAIANFLGKIFGAIYRIPLSNMLGASGMGLYQMAFPIYSFLLTFITGGISVTLSKNIAKHRAENNNVLIYKQFKLAKNTSIAYGAIITLLLVSMAYPIASLQGNSSAHYGYFAISIGFVFASVLGAYRGYYQGHGKMMPTATSQIIEQISKLIFGLYLSFILVKKSLILGVCGALFGVSIGEIVSFIYFLFKRKKIKKQSVNLSLNDYKFFIKEFMPISVSYGILPLSSLIDSFLVINLLKTSGLNNAISTSLYGIETGMIVPLINIPNVIISAIAITIVPTISYKLAKGEEISYNLNSIIKTVFILMLPCVVGIYILSPEIIKAIYPYLESEYLLTASNLLKISAFEMFFVCFVSITNASLQALGKTKLPMISLFSGVILKTVLELFLIITPSINIIGLVVSSLFGYFLTSVINVLALKRAHNIRLNLKSIIVPISACFIMSLVLFLYVKRAI